MTCRIAIAFALFSCFLLAAGAAAQPGDRYLVMKSRVLDIVFPLEVAPKPYIRKLIMRFGDDDSQLVVVVYPGAKCEIVRYNLAGMSGGELSQLISNMVAENPNVKDQEIAAHLKVDVSRSLVEHDALIRVLDKLKVIRISPILADRTALDGAVEYEYWYDTWQESVHYTIAGPFNDSRQDRLVQWMLRFREDLPDLLKASSEDTE